MQNPSFISYSWSISVFIFASESSNTQQIAAGGLLKMAVKLLLLTQAEELYKLKNPENMDPLSSWLLFLAVDC